jgi:predicted acyl esterase
MVAMRDGVKLSTDVYLPGDGKGKYPVIVARTPYDKSKGGSALAAKGHRLRVAVSSSNSPRFEANPNTGKPFRADGETRVAKNTLHLSLKYPSRIILPVVKAINDP